jgi:ureidoglycolate lyase
LTPNDLEPDVPAALPWHETPIVRATDALLEGYGRLVDDPAQCPIEIVRWPAAGRRPVDADTGDQGGTAVGEFAFWWDGDAMFGRNTAVGDQYLLGWSRNPGEAARGGAPTAPRDRLLLWHAHYHPDGGQLFFPLNGEPFVTALALPGDDVTPDDFVTFYVDGGRGLYVHPNVWHEAVFPLSTPSRFHDAQGRVHARVSVNFATEFGVFLSMPMRAPGIPARKGG